jgi:hypothetical protein
MAGDSGWVIGVAINLVRSSSAAGHVQKQKNMLETGLSSHIVPTRKHHVCQITSVIILHGHL